MTNDQFNYEYKSLNKSLLEIPDEDKNFNLGNIDKSFANAQLKELDICEENTDVNVFQA